MCVSVQGSSVVPRHPAADAQLIIQAVRPSWRRALIWSTTKEKRKYFSFLTFPNFRKSFLLYEDPQILPVSPVERIFEDEGSMEHWWKDTDTWNGSTEGDTCPIAILSFTKSTGSRRGSNPGCCSGRPKTYHL